METNMLRGAVLFLMVLASVHQARGQASRPGPRNNLSGGGNDNHSNRKPRDPLAGGVGVGCSVFKDKRTTELLVNGSDISDRKDVHTAMKSVFT